MTYSEATIRCFTLKNDVSFNIHIGPERYFKFNLVTLTNKDLEKRTSKLSGFKRFATQLLALADDDLIYHLGFVLGAWLRNSEALKEMNPSISQCVALMFGDNLEPQEVTIEYAPKSINGALNYFSHDFDVFFANLRAAIPNELQINLLKPKKTQQNNVHNQALPLQQVDGNDLAINIGVPPLVQNPTAQPRRNPPRKVRGG
jgi:hypothetical protein